MLPAGPITHVPVLVGGAEVCRRGVAGAHRRGRVRGGLPGQLGGRQGTDQDYTQQR